MIGIDEFLKMFGNIRLVTIVELILAIVFLCLIYKKIKEYLIKKHDLQEQKDKNLEEALAAVRKYPEYRQQSICIQTNLEGQIKELKEMCIQNKIHLQKMEKDTEKRERNKLRDRLLHNYRYYTSLETNPSQSWTEMESEAFWELFTDYENAGGNGFMHTDVQPAMNRLTVIRMNSNKKN